jgi:hypothetical protein
VEAGTGTEETRQEARLTVGLSRRNLAYGYGPYFVNYIVTQNRANTMNEIRISDLATMARKGARAHKKTNIECTETFERSGMMNVLRNAG